MVFFDTIYESVNYGALRHSQWSAAWPVPDEFGGSAKQDPWVGLRRLLEPLPEHAETIFLERSERRKTVKARKGSWPVNEGGVVKNARIMGHDWIVHSCEAGSQIYTTAHHNIHFNFASQYIVQYHELYTRIPNIIYDGCAVLVGGHYNYYHNVIDYYINYFYYLRLFYVLATQNSENFEPVRAAKKLISAEHKSFHREIAEIVGLNKDDIIQVRHEDTVKCHTLIILPRFVTGNGFIRDISSARWFQNLIQPAGGNET